MANEIAKPNNTSLSPSQRIKQVLGIKSVQEMIVQAVPAGTLPIKAV